MFSHDPAQLVKCDRKPTQAQQQHDVSISNSKAALLPISFYHCKYSITFFSSLFTSHELSAILGNNVLYYIYFNTFICNVSGITKKRLQNLTLYIHI